MYVQVEAVDADGERQPKTIVVSHHAVVIRQTGQELWLTTEEFDDTRPRSGATVATTIRRAASVHLSRVDLQGIVNAAVKARLVSLPGYTALIDIRKCLEKATGELGIGTK